jgi:hypothetical protein
VYPENWLFRTLDTGGEVTATPYSWQTQRSVRDKDSVPAASFDLAHRLHGTPDRRDGAASSAVRAAYALRSERQDPRCCGFAG